MAVTRIGPTGFAAAFAGFTAKRSRLGKGAGMNLSRREIVDEFLTWRNAINDPGQRKLAETLLNRAYMDVWLAHPWNDHRLPSVIQITTVAGQREYALPQYFGSLPIQVETLTNLSTGRPIALRTLDQIQQEHPTSGTTLETSGDPVRACISGQVGVTVQPAAGGQALEVLSTDANDIDVRVLVEGVNSQGDWDAAQVILTGVTPVALGTWQSPLVNFAKAYDADTEPPTPMTSSRGAVTLRVAAAGATLQKLLPAESAREFPSLVLSPKPQAAGQIIGVPAIRAPKRLIHDADEVPKFWGSAILERMWQFWGSASGENDTFITKGPQLVTLVSFDNQSAVGRMRRRPFLG